MAPAERPRLTLRGHALRAGLLLLALLVPVLLFSTQLYVSALARSTRVSIWGIAILQCCEWYLWAIAGPLVWGLARRWPLTGRHRRANALRHAGAAVLVSVCILGGYLVLYHLFTGIPRLGGLFIGFERSWRTTALFTYAYLFPLELLVYAGVVASAQAVNSTRELNAREEDALRLSAELTKTKLQVLRAQLQPHFLFNALHTIGSFVLQKRNAQAMETLVELGDVLRLTLERGETDLVTLRDELNYLRRYLHIEEARFGDRLTVDWRIETGTLDVLVPAFILQPIVENALKHGVAKELSEVRLEIRAVLEGDSLRISVFNEGPQLPLSWSLERNAGFGLTNVRDRLRYRTPVCRLALNNVDEKGVLAVLEFPGSQRQASG
jgi:two-component system, LytTR family, sensor kinase